MYLAKAFCHPYEYLQGTPKLYSLGYAQGLDWRCCQTPIHVVCKDICVTGKCLISGNLWKATVP